MYILYGPSIKSGTWNIPEHQTVIIIKQKMRKIKFSKLKYTKHKLVSARNMKIYFGGGVRGVGSGGVESVGYSFDRPQ